VADRQQPAGAAPIEPPGLPARAVAPQTVVAPAVVIPAPPLTFPAPGAAPAAAEDADENGVDRDRVSVPYQNSVASVAGLAWVRMMCGVMDNTISLFSRSLLCEPNRRPTRGISLKPGMPAALRVSES
jgi:hypothetical protein